MKQMPQRETTLAAKGSDKSRQAKQQNAALTHGAPNKEMEGGRKERIARTKREDCEKVGRGLRESGERIVRVL